MITFGTSPKVVTLQAELNSLTTGVDKAVIPCGWHSTYNVVIEYVAIFALNTPGKAHSFTFFKTGNALSGGAVTMSASGNFWITYLSGTDRALKGLTDYITVRHDTTAQDADDETQHVNEGGRIWAVVGLKR